ncbi:MFS transporter [Lactiplantibacillus sp. WILCCON 0030]|uniref:MFS transporter n=1 Tax=Lactiplantibacillus brownii TaxID=3069269 RepID=A0ABU1AAN3_9LACO|nr:MFS transporter [Lactiplantibacillus brownii]MDQ7937921.1 MFS transporter [Lactiplantibacillus brownii]
MIKFIKNNQVFTALSGINLFSKIGDRLFYTTMLTLAATIPQANFAVMLVSISETAPILFSFFLGSLADTKSNKLAHLIQNSVTRSIVFLIIAWLCRNSMTLILIFFIACFNFIADLLGNFSSALISPFTKVLVTKEDMPQAQGIISVTAQLVSILATLLGSLMLSFFLSRTVAIANAGIFLLVGISFFLITPYLTHVSKDIPINHQHNIWLLVKTNFKSLLQDKKLLNDLIQLSLLNGFFGGVTPIFTLFIQKGTATIFFSRPLTIALLSGIVTVSMLLGNGCSVKLLTSTTNSTLSLIADFFIAVSGLGFFTRHIFLVFIGTGIVAFFLGMISPRFSTNIINKYPTQQLGGMITTVNSCLVLAPPVTSLLFPLLSNINLNFAYCGFVVYALLLIIIRIPISKKIAKSSHY